MYPVAHGVLLKQMALPTADSSVVVVHKTEEESFLSGYRDLHKAGLPFYH